MSHRTTVNAALAALLRAEGGVISRPAALRVVPEHVVKHAIRAGQVRPVYPGVLVARKLLASRTARWRAALLRAGPDAALSHLSALEVWDLPVPGRDEVHVTIARDRRLRVAGIVAHRRAGFVAEPPAVVVRQDVAVTRLERTLVDAWSLLEGDTQRAPLLAAVGRRWTTADRVLAALRAHPPGRADQATLRVLLHKLTIGCRSELELWGYDRVFVGPGMPALDRQVPVSIDGRTIYLDLLHRPTLTNFELDGTKWHDGLSQRDRDVGRDADLAKLGIHTIRFTHDRLRLEPDAVRRDVLAILDRRAELVVNPDDTNRTLGHPV